MEDTTMNPINPATEEEQKVEGQTPTTTEEEQKVEGETPVAEEQAA